MAKLLANSGDPDQMLHSVVSDLGLHCLPITFSGVSELKLVNRNYFTELVLLSSQPIRVIFTPDNIFLISLIYVVGKHQKPLSKALLMRTDSICFCGVLRKTSILLCEKKKHLISILIELGFNDTSTLVGHFVSSP